MPDIKRGDQGADETVGSFVIMWWKLKKSGHVFKLHVPSCSFTGVVVLYGCETWSLTLMEERRLRVFENRVLRRIYGPKRDEVTGEWRRLHNKELYSLYS